MAAQAHRPDLLLLDEPSSGLDPIVRRDILAAILRSVGEEGRAVVFSSHLLNEVEAVCDRVVRISQGKVVLSDTLAGIRAAHHLLTVRFPVAAAARRPSASASGSVTVSSFFQCAAACDRSASWICPTHCNPV